MMILEQLEVSLVLGRERDSHDGRWTNLDFLDALGDV